MSCSHWLLGPHHSLSRKLPVLEAAALIPGIVLVPVTLERVAAFIEFEQSISHRRVGTPLLHHLALFGDRFAMLALNASMPMGLIRTRLFHEWDPQLSTLLVANFCVHPDHRNRKIGSSMVAHISNLLLASRYVEAIGAEVAEANLASLRVFTNNGFELVGRSSETKCILVRRNAQ